MWGKTCQIWMLLLKHPVVVDPKFSRGRNSEIKHCLNIYGIDPGRWLLIEKITKNRQCLGWLFLKNPRLVETACMVSATLCYFAAHHECGDAHLVWLLVLWLLFFLRAASAAVCCRLLGDEMTSKLLWHKKNTKELVKICVDTYNYIYILYNIYIWYIIYL